MPFSKFEIFEKFFSKIFKVRILKKSFSASNFAPSNQHATRLQAARVRERFAAEAARVLALRLFMHLLDVQLQVVLQRELLGTVCALEHFGAMRFFVRVQRRRRRQVFAAVRAAIVADAKMGGLFVHRFGAVLGKCFVAKLAFVPAHEKGTRAFFWSANFVCLSYMV